MFWLVFQVFWNFKAVSLFQHKVLKSHLFSIHFLSKGTNQYFSSKAAAHGSHLLPLLSLIESK